MITYFARLVRPIFGEFEEEEFKKFLRLGVLFGCMLGIYCGLRPLKNGIFCTFVGAHQLPWAKMTSLFLLVPLVMFYTKLLDRYKRENTFYILSYAYGILAVVFAIYFYFATGTATTTDLEAAGGLAYWGTLVINYLFYIWTESYGTLLLALFWAISTDITSPDSAKRGFSFVVAVGQIGGIVGPSLIAGLPDVLGHSTSTLSFVLVIITILVSIFLLKNFFKVTPPELLISYRGENELVDEKKQEAGFLEGFWLLVSNKYLLGIFAVVAIPDFIVTIVDLHFNALAAQQYSGTALLRFHGYYGSAANILAFLFLILGAGKITKIFGIGVSLLLMPIVYGFAVLGFISLNSLSFLFILLASSKAINYALNGPAIKQLYIPTTHDVRFKSQAWIETFGSRISIGSFFNMSLGPMQAQLGAVAGRARHAVVASYISFAIIGVWVFIALYLGRTHKKAVAEKKVVC